MKILICSTLFPGLAGIPKYTKGISKEFLKRGHSVTILCEKEKDLPYEEILDDMKIIRHEFDNNLIKYQKQVSKKIDTLPLDFDLIIVLWYKYFKPIKEKFKDNKIIYVVPSVRKVDIKILNKNKPLFKKLYYHLINRYSIWLEKKAIFKSSKVVALGKQMKKQIEVNYNHFDSVIINPGVDNEIFKYKKIKRTNDFLIVANLDPRKGIDRAIETAKYLKKGRIKVLGGGKRKELYQSFIEENNLSSKIILAGPSNSVEKEMAKSKGLLMTSYSEGFPLIYPEALTMGLPIIAFKQDGKRIMNSSSEVVKSGNNGYLVQTEREMAEKMEKLIESQKLFEKMEKESLKESKNYSWKLCVDNLLNI